MHHVIQRKAGNKEQGQRKLGQDRGHSNQIVSRLTQDKNENGTRSIVQKER